MSNQDKKLIQELRKRMPPEIEKHLKRLIVFGSRVNGETTEDSDLDIIALVDEKSPEIERLFEDFVYQVMWAHDFDPIISLKVLSESSFYDALHKGFSFYRNIEKEGVSV